MKQATVGVDIGGTNIVTGVVTRDGDLIYVHQTETRGLERGEAVMKRCLVEISRAIAATDGAVSIQAVGIGTPGQIDYAQGRVSHVTNSLPGWNEIPITSRVSDAFSLPAFIENDANAAALGETWFGAARGARHVVCVTLGTGVGGGIISDGKLIRGVSGSAGGLGHLSVDPDGPPCYCGNRGCVELYSSGKAITAIAREEAEKHPESLLAQSEIAGAHTVVAAAEQGDDLARQIMRRAGEALGESLVHVVNVMNPEKIVFTGGVAKAGDWLLGPVREYLTSRPLPAARSNLEIVVSNLDGLSGLYGAAALAQYLLDETN